MPLPTLPPQIELDAETRKGVIGGLKLVMTRFQERQLLDPAINYQALISDPDLLQSFIWLFVDHRDLCDDIVQGKNGEPVRDEDTLLICKVTLNQIQQLLVRTCARKMFEHEKSLQTVTETVTRKALFGLIKKTEQVETQRLGHDPVEERKLRELLQYVAFAWQLPLLSAYRQHLTLPQMVELGDGILALRSPDNIAKVGRFDAQVLRKTKTTSGPDFPDILAHQPNAIGGVAAWSRDMYEFYRKLLGDKAWTFFARETKFFNSVAALDKTAAKVYGDVLCFIAADNLDELQRLNLDKTEVMVTSLRGALGDRLPLVISQPAFAKDILRKIVDNLLHMNQEKDVLMTSFALTMRSMEGTIMDWLTKLNESQETA